MKFLMAIFFLFPTKLVHSKEVSYDGQVMFKAETNMPGMNIEGTSKNFKILKADFTEDNSHLKKIEAEIDAETLKTGIELRDRHMYEKIFLALSSNEKPSLLKMMMDKSICEKKGDNLNCTGDAAFTLGKKNFTRKLELKFDNKLNTDVSFNISLKELAIAIPSYLGIELEDGVAIKMKAIRK